MTNEQLAVLLFHIVRQINLHATELERKVTEEDLMNLRGLADALTAQARQLAPGTRL